MPENPTREIFLHLATWQQVVFYVVGGLASVTFVYGFWLRLRKYRRGRPDGSLPLCASPDWLSRW